MLTLNPQLFLETLLLEIRGKTIGYCARKKRMGQSAQNLAVHRLELLEMASDKSPDNLEVQRQLQLAKEEVEAYAKQASEAALVRARVKWKIDGERPSKYFCNLEKNNAIQKYIPKLCSKDSLGQELIIKNQSDIDRELYKYYQNLYKSQEEKMEILSIEEFLNEPSDKVRLTIQEASSLEGLLTLEEATQYMKKCRADASPGSDGFTGGFFKLFWRNLKKFVINSLNFAYETGNLSISQRLGVIILLPKPEKDKRQITNWRPISLLNHTYKILSGVLSECVKPVLPSVVAGNINISRQLEESLL